MMDDFAIPLENERVRLDPLTLENYRNLIPTASQNKLVCYSPSDIETPKALKSYVETALGHKKEKQAFRLSYSTRKNNNMQAAPDL